MAIPTPEASGRATLDFGAAQASARRRTIWLVASFSLALALAVAILYVGLLLSWRGALGPASVGGGWLPRPDLLRASALVVFAITGLGFSYHTARLAGGGGQALVESLRGVLVDRETRDVSLRRFVNVAEEMAIAAGTPVPALYVLERERGINAFAASDRSGRKLVAVTRGALDRLTRDELQGVVAHELSHVVHDDMGVDLWLVAAVGALGVLTFLGDLLSRDRFTVGTIRITAKEGNPFAVVGLPLLAAGIIGTFCGKLVRFAVARQREWLADATAVQYTRNPSGLASALLKIAEEGSAVASPHARAAAHLFLARIGSGFWDGLLSTHPPIEERIRRIAPDAPLPAPGARGEQRAVEEMGTPAEEPVLMTQPVPVPAPPAGEPARAEPWALATPPTLASRPPAAGITAPLAQARRPAPADSGAEPAAGSAAALMGAAREPAGARALACALFVEEAPAIRGEQLALLSRRDRPLATLVQRFLPALEGQGRSAQMTLVALSLPALDLLPAASRSELAAHLEALAAAGDGTANPFAVGARQMVLRQLSQAGAAPRARLRALDDIAPECLLLLSALARAVGRDPGAAQAALDVGVRALGAGGRWRLAAADRTDPAQLGPVLSHLAGASASLKARVVAASAALLLSGGEVSREPAELLGKISASLGLPVPPLDGAVAAASRLAPGSFGVRAESAEPSAR